MWFKRVHTFPCLAHVNTLLHGPPYKHSPWYDWLKDSSWCWLLLRDMLTSSKWEVKGSLLHQLTADVPLAGLWLVLLITDNCLDKWRLVGGAIGGQAHCNGINGMVYNTSHIWKSHSIYSIPAITMCPSYCRSSHQPPWSRHSNIVSSASMVWIGPLVVIYKIFHNLFR